MSEQPYAPPKSPVRDAQRPPKSPLVSVLTGAAIDVGGSLLFGAVLAMGYAAVLSVQGTSEEEIADAILNAPVDSWYFMIGSLIGGVFSFLGGYVCARLAQKDEYRLGAIVAAISVVVSWMLGGQAFGFALNVFFALLTAAVVLAGAHYGRERNLARRAG